MRVLFLIQDESLPSSRVRICNLIGELEKNGISCSVRVYPRSIRSKLKLLPEVIRHDAVLLQKKLPSPFDAAVLKAFSRKLIFDFDDAIHLRHESQGESRSNSRKIKAKAIISRSDLVIAGNRVLKSYAEQYNSNVRVVPSSVEVRGTPVKNHSDREGPVIIGWVGGSINLGQLQTIGGALNNLSKKYPVVLHVICDQGLELPGVTVEHIPWTLESQADEIARFDIGIMPLPSSPHAEGKCGYKALQCMAASVPVVVSDVGGNRDIVQDDAEGFVARDETEFEEALEKLITSPGLRAEMGARARKKVEAEYAVESTGRRLADLIKACASR